MTHAVIRLRGDINIRSDIKDTLKFLRINRINHCVLLGEDEISKGMLQKAKDYITWGEVKPEIIARMIVTRGRLTGNKAITNEYIKKNSPHSTIMEFAKAINEDKTKYSNLKMVKPLFRLHPPLKGYEGIKRTFKVGGALGYRGEAINDLIIKMLGPETKKESPKKKSGTKSTKKKVAKKASDDKTPPGKKKTSTPKKKPKGKKEEGK